MEEQNNTEMNSQPQVQETENVQTETPNETKPPKKKRNWLFTLFACIMTAIIVALAMNIGQQLSKGMEKKSSGTSNSNSNEVSNSNSNETSNSNSNETTNCNTTEPKTTVYTNKDVTGVYEYVANDNTYDIRILNDGLFSTTHGVKDVGCGETLEGNYYIDGDTIYFNTLVNFTCSGQGEKSISTFSAKIDNGNLIVSEDSFKNKNVTYKKTNESVKNLEGNTKDFLDTMYSVIEQGAKINKQN
jgi:hypothetical protein